MLALDRGPLDEQELVWIGWRAQAEARLARARGQAQGRRAQLDPAADRDFE